MLTDRPPPWPTNSCAASLGACRYCVAKPLTVRFSTTLPTVAPTAELPDALTSPAVIDPAQVTAEKVLAPKLESRDKDRYESPPSAVLTVRGAEQATALIFELPELQIIAAFVAGMLP